MYRLAKWVTITSAFLFLLLIGCAPVETPPEAGMPAGVYVATSGNDANTGLSPSSPLLTIQNAVDIAGENGLSYIYVAEGTYGEDSGLRSSYDWYQGIYITLSGLQLKGGYNSGFTAQVGKSVLDVTGCAAPYRPIQVSYASGVRINGFVVKGGECSSGTFPQNAGGGLLLYSASDTVVENVIIMKNEAEYGGGVCDYSGNNNSINGTIVSNHASIRAGGLYTESTLNMKFNGIIRYNSADDKGGGIYVFGGMNNSIKGAIDHNSAPVKAGGVMVYNSVGNTVEAVVSANTSTNGAGITIWDGENNSVNSTVSNNTAYSSGGGIKVEGASGSQISGSISKNDAVTGGGVTVDAAGGTLINSSINNNSASSGGGGIMTYDATNLIIQGNMQQNNAGSAYGGGAIMIVSGLNTIIQSLTLKDNNSAKGSAIKLEDAPGVTIKNTLMTFTSNNNSGSSLVELIDFAGGSSISGLNMTNLTMNGGGLDNIIRESGSGIDVTGQKINGCTFMTNGGSLLYQNQNGNTATNIGQLQSVSGAAEANGNEQTGVTNQEADPDTTPPTISIDEPAPGSKVEEDDLNDDGCVDIGGPVVDNAGGSGISHVEITIDFTPYEPADYDESESNWTFSAALGNGNHTVTVRAIDNNGNTSAEASVTFSVDITVIHPTLVNQTPTNNTTMKIAAGVASTNIKFTGTAQSDPKHPLDGLFVSIDGGAFVKQKTLSGTNISWDITLQFGKGEHTARFYVSDDRDGNISSTNSVHFTISQGGSFVAGWTYPSSVGTLAYIAQYNGFLYAVGSANYIVVPKCSLLSNYSTHYYYKCNGGVINYNGSLYVADNYNQNIVKLNLDYSVALTYKKTVSMGMMNDVMGLASDGTYLYASMKNAAIEKFNMVNTNALGWWGCNSSGVFNWYSSAGTLPYVGTVNNGAMKDPQGVACNGTYVYVADSGNSRINVYNPGGTFAFSFGSLGTNTSQLRLPKGIAVDATYVYVVDAGNNRLSVFTPTGVFVALLGSYGSGMGFFSNPVGICIDNEFIYVTDYVGGKSRIQKWSKP
ncbi:MAG: hypothetical protein HPY53_09120 [Brevinematales bacterium]|nr:hypothetical protein [Brevinematales bacterium]